MGSFSGEPYMRYCPDCDDHHPCGDRPDQPRWTKIAELPESAAPWIAVKYKGDIIFANEEWAPRVLKANGVWGVLKAHLPHDLR